MIKLVMQLCCGVSILESSVRDVLVIVEMNCSEGEKINTGV
jgi:hypothetical protein